MFHVILQQDVYDPRIGQYGKTLRMIKEVDLPIAPFPGLLIEFYDKQGRYEEWVIEAVYCNPVSQEITAMQTYTLEDNDDPENTLAWWEKSLKKDGWVKVNDN